MQTLPVDAVRLARNVALAIHDDVRRDGSHSRSTDNDRQFVEHTPHMYTLMDFIARQFCNRLDTACDSGKGDLLCGIDPVEVTAYLMHGIEIYDWLSFWHSLGGNEPRCVLWKGAFTNNNERGFAQVRRHEGFYRTTPRAFTTSRSGASRANKIRLDRLIQFAANSDQRMGRDWGKFKLRHTCGEYRCINLSHFEVRARPVTKRGKKRKRQLGISNCQTELVVI